MVRFTSRGITDPVEEAPSFSLFGSTSGGVNYAPISSGISGGPTKTPESEAERRPFAGVGKTTFSLYGRSPTPPLEGVGPEMPSVDMSLVQEEKREEAPWEGLMRWVESFNDVVSPILAPGSGPMRAQQKAQNAWDRALNGDDPLLAGLATQWKAKIDSNEIDTYHALAAFYDQYMQIEARRRGESGYLQQAVAPSMVRFRNQAGDIDPMMGLTGTIGELLKPLNVGAYTVQRSLSGEIEIGGMQLHRDRIEETLEEYDKGNHGRLTEGLVDLTEEYKAGRLNEDEFRDLILLEGFGLTNPDPLSNNKEEGLLGFGQAVANAGVSLALEVFTDPLTYLTLGVGKAASVAAGVSKRALPKVTEAVVANATRGLERAAAEEAASIARSTFTRRVEEEALRFTGGTKKSLTDIDYLKAVQRIGVEDEALRPVISEALGSVRGADFALKYEGIIRAGQAIDRALDPLTLVGRTMGSAKARLFMSNTAAEGYFNGLGWLNVWKTDRAMRIAGLSDDFISELDGRAAANHALQVGNETAMRTMRASASWDPDVVGVTAAQNAAEMAGNNLTGLMARQVDRTAEYIVPTGGRGGLARGLTAWRDEARVMLAEMGAKGDIGRAVEAMGEQQLRVLRNRYWAFVGGNLIDTAAKAKPTKKFTQDMIDRVTLLGAHQMTEKIRKTLLEKLRAGDVAAIREAAERYDSLRVNLHSAADDDEYAKLAMAVLKGLAGTLPEAITDKSILPKELRAWLDRFGPQGYRLALSPEEIAGLIYDEGRNIVGVRSWVDFVKGAAPAARVGRTRAAFVDMTRGISGASIELNARRRFVQHVAEMTGASEADGLEIYRRIKDTADRAGLAPRGLSIEQMERAIYDSKVSQSVKNDARRSIVDAVLYAYQNEVRLVGVTQAFTGEMKRRFGAWNNWLGYISENFYPNVRFSRNPFFQLQELTEYPFFMALRGKFPVRAAIASLPGAKSIPGVGGALAEQAEKKNLFDRKTRFLMEYFKADSGYVNSDMIEQSQHVLRGLLASERIAMRAGRLDAGFENLVQKANRATTLGPRKSAAEATLYRERLGAELRDAIMEESPMTWYAVKSQYPNMSDGEVAVNWLFDLVARTDPKSPWNAVLPDAIRPSYLGRRAVLSNDLISHIGFGTTTDAAGVPKHLSFSQMRRKIASANDPASFVQVEDALRSAGAAEDYIERARWALTGPSTDRFYELAEAAGLSRDQSKALREADELAARRLGISLPEYLGRRWTDAPQTVDQFGKVRGASYFQQIVDSLETRGLTAPERGSEMLAALTAHGETLVPIWERYLPVPEGTKIKDLPKDIRDARAKVVGWQGAREARAADPSKGAPPTVGRKPLYQNERHTFGSLSYEDWVRQLEVAIPDEATRREFADWYTDMQRGFLALFSDVPERQVEQAAKLIVAFGVTQLNTSPALGMEFLYRVMSMARRGEDWPSALGLSAADGKRLRQASGGLNFSQLEQLLMERGGGKAVPEQLGQKLADFIDSLIGRRERSVGIPGPDIERPWGPVAGDVWAKRDLGFLDPKMGKEVWRVVDGGASSKVIGAQRKDAAGRLVVDSDGDPIYVKVDRIEVYDAKGKRIKTFKGDHITDSVPTNHEYDYIVEYYNGLSHHLNEIAYLGKTDWTAADAQAVGWFRAKRTFGDATGDVRSALFKGRWTVGSEVNPVAGARYSDIIPGADALSAESMAAINDEMTYHVIRQALDDTGALSPRPRGLTPGSMVTAGGDVIDAPHVEVLGDRSVAVQMAARLGLYGQMDEVVLMRDTLIKTADYVNAKGKGNIGYAVRVPVESKEEGLSLLRGIASDAPDFPRGAHIAQTDDGSWVVQALWDPGTGASDLRAFNKAVPQKRLDQWMTEYLGRPVAQERGPVEFVKVSNDWSANPDGSGYLDVVKQPSHVARGRGAQPSPTAGELERASVRDLTARLEDIVQRTVPREAAADRTGRLLAGLPADDGSGAIRSADDLLARGDAQFQRAPAGTRGAVVRAADGRHALFLGGRTGAARVRADTLLHELAHTFANDLDPSAVRRIKGIKAGAEGAAPGSSRGRNAHRLTQDDHEWFVDQFLLWARDPNSVHTTLRPLMAQLRDDIQKSPLAHDIGLRSIQPLEQAVTRADAAVKAGKAAGASPAEMRALRATARDAKAALKEAKEAGGRLDPEMRAFFDQMAEAAKRPEPRAMWDMDEKLMFDMARNGHMRATNAAKSIVHFRPERSWLERSLNHPFFGMYPLSYMYGKVLPELVEFLMFRPFGQKAPGLAMSVTNRMYQSFMNQQEHDPELRQFLFENEPAMRTLSMYVPGVPWDLPVNAPLALRRWMEWMQTVEQKRLEGVAEEDLPEFDPAKVLGDIVSYQVGPARTPQALGETWEGLQAIPNVLGRVMGGNREPLPEGEVDDTTGPFRDVVLPSPSPQGSTPEVINVGRASVPAGEIEGTIQNQMQQLEQALQGAGQ